MITKNFVINYVPFSKTRISGFSLRWHGGRRNDVHRENGGVHRSRISITQMEAGTEFTLFMIRYRSGFILFRKQGSL